MNRGVGALLAAVGVVVLAGCGSSDSGKDGGGAALPGFGPVVAAAPVSGPPITEAAVLNDRLLAAQDLPSGMEPAPRSDMDTTTAVGQAQTDPAVCAQVLRPLARQRPDALTRGAVGYNGPNFSSVDIDAATYPNDKLASAFADFQQVLRKCAKYSGTDADKTVIDYRVGGLTQSPAGDASTAFQMRLTSEGLTLVSLVSLVQVGNTLLQISVTAPESVDPGLLGDLTTAQVRRFSTAAP